MDELDREDMQPAKRRVDDAAGDAALPVPPARPGFWHLELAGWRASAAQMREAWAGLYDNPLARYWTLAQQRRSRRMSTLRRHLPALATLLMMAVLYFFVYQVQSSSFTTPYEDLAAALYIIVLPTGFIWLLSGLYDAMRDAATLLSKTERKLKPGQLDELLAVAPLSNHHLLAGALRVLLPPLWLRIAVGAVLGWITLLTVTYEQSSYWSDKLMQALTLAPLTIGAVGLSGMLGGTALVLLAVVMGHRTRHGMAAGTIAGLFVVWPPLWLGISMTFAMSIAYGDETLQSLSWALAAIAVFLSVLLLSLWVAASTRLKPAVALLGVPLGLLLVVTISGVLLDFWSSSWFQPLGQYLLPNLVWSWGCFAPLSPLAIPSPLCWGEEQLAAGYFSFTHLGMLLVLQALVVALLSRHALLHMQQRRREMG